MIGILLAAGRGTRMKSEVPKVLFKVNDEIMGFAGLRALWDICDTVAVVVAYGAAEVKASLEKRLEEYIGSNASQKKLLFFTQEKLSGTGDALRTAMVGLGKGAEAYKEVLVLNGDLPLIRSETLKFLLKMKSQSKVNAACLSLKMKDPFGLGRILRDDTGVFEGIREEKDAQSDEKKIREVNGGVYCFDTNSVFESLKDLKNENNQKEFYLTDLLKNSKNLSSEAFMVPNSWDLYGVNTTFELSVARRVAQTRLQKQLAEEWGVDFMDPASTMVSARSKFKGSCCIGPGTQIKGNSIIEKGVELQGMNFIESSHLHEGAKILWGTVIRDSIVENGASVGPMAHLRPDSVVGPHSKVGNFVELKNTRLESDTKVSHLSYLGDAHVGEGSNVGCGTITCNYDGFQKHATYIEKGVFVGSDTQLIAPVRIGEGAYVASGTTVTQDIPAGALVLSRGPLVIKEGYAKKLAEKRAAHKAGKKAKS